MMNAPFLLCCAFAVILCIANAAEQHNEDTVAMTKAADLDTGGLSRELFPKGFVFGTATSAYQVEGMANKDGRGPSIWDAFVKVPGHIANNDTADVAVDQYHHYKEDIDLMAKFNFDAYRFSISWSRIFPEGTGRVNWKGVDYYNRLIDYLIKKGITPYGNLYHYDLPLALQEKYNGWLNRQSVEDYANYADFCFKTFGDRVKNWFTFNEPRIVAALGFDNGINPPSRCSKEFGNCTAGNSATEPYIVAHNLILSHATAVKRYREKYQDKQKGRIGILLDFNWYEPLTRSKADEYAAQRARDFHVGWFLHPIRYGEYPRTMQEIVGERLPKFTKDEIKMVNGSMDYVGINQYTTSYIYDPKQSKPNVTGYQADWNAGFANAKNGVQIGPKANSWWLYIVPWGMYKAVTYVKERYGNLNIIISENGMDDPGNGTLPNALNDTTRINFFKDYMTQLKKAIDDGANVTGYFAWSLLDNFEWLSGYTSRFGIVYVDYTTLRRYPKMSASWFQKLLEKKK
ncbi:beta-glucosidase 44-like [Herrania umbratica]|uniref:Beta-glucosidase 44-like n=1 Tax=Herrania umbratica TaxID=108875 RepID=A0A6J1BBH8_9ROSI|nr:beta-glucosidase 44-like [Herrania umbratica]